MGLREDKAVVRKFWEMLGSITRHTMEQDMPEEGIFRVKTRDGYTRSETFWHVFQRFPFHILYAGARSESNLEIEFRVYHIEDETYLSEAELIPPNDRREEEDTTQTVPDDGYGYGYSNPYSNPPLSHVRFDVRT